MLTNTSHWGVDVCREHCCPSSGPAVGVGCWKGCRRVARRLPDLLLANKYCNPLANSLRKSIFGRFIPSIRTSASALAGSSVMYHREEIVPNVATELSNRMLQLPLIGKSSIHPGACRFVSGNSIITDTQSPAGRRGLHTRHVWRCAQQRVAAEHRHSIPVILVLEVV